MPVVHIPRALRHLSAGRTQIQVEGVNLRQVFAALERECPGLTARIVEDDDLRKDMAVAIDGSILEGGGLIQPVRAHAEIYLVPPIGGGALPRAVAVSKAPVPGNGAPAGHGAIKQSIDGPTAAREVTL